MGNYITYCCKLYFTGEDEEFDEIVLRSLPRKGEHVWFQRKNDEGDYERDVIVQVEDVMHVGETDDEFPYVQLTVAEVAQEDPVDDEFEATHNLDSYDPNHPRVALECENCKFRTNIPHDKCCAFTKQMVIG